MTTTQTETIFFIPAVNMDALNERIAKLNKRATKLGCKPIALNIGHVEKRDNVVGFPLTIDYEPIVINGWTFLGTVQLLDGANIVRCVPGHEMPREHRDATDWCDHCRSRRGRKDVFVVRNESCATQVVGRSCLADFLGHADPAMIVASMEMLASVEIDLRGFEEIAEAGASRGAYPLDEFVATAVCAVRKFGWAPAAAEYPTKYVVVDMLHGKSGGTKDVTDADYETARQAIAWAESIGDDADDYLLNLRAIAYHGCVDRRTIGLAASLPIAYLRATEKTVMAANSAHFGTVKKREVFALTVDKVIDVCSQWGVTHIHIMTDAHGNVAVWKTGSVKLDKGTYKMKATVSDHTVYNDVAQTVLKNCTVVDRLDMAA